MSRKKTVIDVGDMTHRALRQTIAKLREAPDQYINDTSVTNPVTAPTPDVNGGLNKKCPSCGSRRDWEAEIGECMSCGYYKYDAQAMGARHRMGEASDERPWIDPARDATPRLSRTKQGDAPSLGDPDEDAPMECVDCGTPFNGYHAVPDENDPTRCEDCVDHVGVTARPYDDGVDKVVERALRGLGYSATEAALMNEAAVSRIDLERGLAILTRSGLIKRSRIDQEVRLIREAEGDDEGGDDDAAVEDALGGGDDAAGGGDDDASAGVTPQAETGDSLDAQVDKYLLDYENDAKGASSGPKMESCRHRSLRRLHEVDDGDDTITAAGGTAAGASENKDIDVEKFATSVARLIQNPDNLIEFKDTLMKRAANYLKKAYPDEVVEGFNKVMRDQFQLEAGKSEFDMEDEFEAPRAAQAGPGGGGGV